MEGTRRRARSRLTVTYRVDGRQYVAVPTGIGVFRALTATILPEMYQPANGQAIYVFALPD